MTGTVQHVLKPASVAVIGASEDLGKFGGRILHNLVKHRFAGRILPVNPNRPTLLGLPGYRSIADAPGPVDLAIVAVPAAQLLDSVEQCGRAGVRAAILFTAQLGEFDEAGRALQDEVLAMARSYGMRLVGPNCMGMIAPSQALGLTSSPTLQHVEALRRGPVAFVSQSGALMGALFILGHDHGVGFSSMVSVGNQADLDLNDFLEGLIEDEATRVICLYIEAVPDGARFLDLARRARAAGKRILAVKAGRTDAGSAMARSHTASLAGSFAGFEAACRATGILLMDEPEGMILAAGVLASAPPMGPGGIGMVVSSGGGGAVMADRLTMAGMPLARWSAATEARLDAHFLPTHRNNPIDLGAHKGALGPRIFADAIDAVADDEGVAAFVYVMTPQPLMPETLDAVIAAWRRTGKPTVFVLDTSRFAENIRQQLLDAGLPFVSRPDDAIRVLEALLRERDMAAGISLPAAIRPRGVAPPSPRAGFLTEPEAKALMASCGIPVTREHVVTTAEEAAAAAGLLGFPVVLKGVSATVVHKSDEGLVKLGLRDAAAVREAFGFVADILAGLGEAPRAVVQEMVRGEAELILGARHDETFGPMVLAGFGGVLVEVLRDVQVMPAPVSAAQAAAMLRRLKLAPLLDGVRGRPPLDVAAAADALSRLSWLAADLGPRLVDLEVNPLMVRATGQGVVAVDGRGTIGKRA